MGRYIGDIIAAVIGISVLALFINNPNSVAFLSGTGKAVTDTFAGAANVGK